MNTEPLTDAEAFYYFLGERLSGDEDRQSLDQLLATWREQREYKQTVAAVQEGVRDAEAGRMRPLRELLDELPSDSASQSSNSS